MPLVDPHLDPGVRALARLAAAAPALGDYSFQSLLLYRRDHFGRRGVPTRSWQAGDERDHGLYYTWIDAPEDSLTVPSFIEATGDQAYVRFHGKNRENCFKRNATAAERSKVPIFGA